MSIIINNKLIDILLTLDEKLKRKQLLNKILFIIYIITDNILLLSIID